MSKYITDNFTGSVVSFLEHCSNLDVNKVEEQVNAEEREDVIKFIMQELDCDECDAKIVYNDIALAEVKESVDKLMSDGIVKIIGHNENNEPLFGLTEFGTSVCKEISKGK
jgi:hypothetical protein